MASSTNQKYMTYRNEKRTESRPLIGTENLVEIEPSFERYSCGQTDTQSTLITILGAVGYFKHTSFSCSHIRRDTMCKHDVIKTLNTPTARSRPESPLPATGICTRQAQRCVRVSLTASTWRRRRTITEIRKYGTYHYHRTTEPRP